MIPTSCQVVNVDLVTTIFYYIAMKIQFCTCMGVLLLLLLLLFSCGCFYVLSCACVFFLSSMCIYIYIYRYFILCIKFFYPHINLT